MNKTLLTLPTLLLSSLSFAQMDTIYSNNEKLVVNVKEITEDVVKFTYPNEDIINTSYKNTINKIVFRSGRTQTFNEGSIYKIVSSINDYENVTVTTLENEIKGLYKIDLVGATDLGSVFANSEKIKDFALKKIKMQASMLGANVVYITDSRNDGAIYGGYYGGYKGAESSISGVAFTNKLLDFKLFSNKIGENKVFKLISESSLSPNSRNYSNFSFSDTTFNLNNVIKENGIIYLEGAINDKINKYILSYFDENHFYIYHENKRSKSFQYKVKF